jgi:hypothetical protein
MTQIGGGTHGSQTRSFAGVGAVVSHLSGGRHAGDHGRHCVSVFIAGA